MKILNTKLWRRGCIVAGLALLCLIGCGRQVEKEVEILCAPGHLARDEAAVLAILEFSSEDLGSRVTLTGDSLESKALFGRIAESVGSTDRSRRHFRLQLYRIRPIVEGTTIELGQADFEGLPKSAIVPNIVIRSGPIGQP